MKKVFINTLLVSVMSVCFFICPCVSIDIEQKSTCNLYKGKWVLDNAYPLYNSSGCPYIGAQFDCIKYGRPDRQYLKYKWQPSGCELPKFDGVKFLSKMRGKKIMFVGDSVSYNTWESLLCLLHAAVGGNNPVKREGGPVGEPISSVTFKKYGVTISAHLTHFLVDVQTTKNGRVLNLDEIHVGGEIWNQQDILIFNSWLWWTRADAKKGWDYISNDGKIVKSMDHMQAYKKALTTWTKWINTMNPPTTKVLFHGSPPTHQNCAKETTPFNGTTAGEPLALKVLKQVLSTTKKVELLDITALSQLRKDGHPGKYNGLLGLNEVDCTHWCVYGVTDTWNQLLYAQLM